MKHLLTPPSAPPCPHSRHPAQGCRCWPGTAGSVAASHKAGRPPAPSRPQHGASGGLRLLQGPRASPQAPRRGRPGPAGPGPPPLRPRPCAGGRRRPPQTSLAPCPLPSAAGGGSPGPRPKPGPGRPHRAEGRRSEPAAAGDAQSAGSGSGGYQATGAARKWGLAATGYVATLSRFVERGGTCRKRPPDAGSPLAEFCPFVRRVRPFAAPPVAALCS